MKRNLSRYLSLLLLLAFLPFACSKQREEPEVRRSNRSDFTVADAKRAFEAIYALRPATRADEPFDEERILDPYRIDPVWESGFAFSDEEYSQVWASFSALYDYRVLRYSDEGAPLLAPLPGRLVVLKEPDTDDVVSWLYFLIPNVQDGFPEAGSPFSGTALYATLSGFPVSAGRYVEGTLVATASLFDDERTAEENAEQLAALLPETLIARLQRQPATRGVNDNNRIEAVEIIGRAPIKIPKLPDKPQEPETSLKPPAFDDRKMLPGSDLGGLFEEDSGKEKSYPNNPHITADKETREILDSLYKDCMGQQLINAVNVDVPIVRDPNRNGCAVVAETSTYSSGRKETTYRILTGKSLSSISLMEELMHLYQGFGTLAFGNAKLNKEIEAKLTWYIYMQKHNEQNDVLAALGGRFGKMNFDIMRTCVLADNLKHEMFPIAYEYAADALRNIKAYKDETKYRFDPNDRDFSNLLKLLEDCMGKYRIE